MTLFYKPRQSNIVSKDGVKKWHPRLVKVGKVIDTQKVGELIAEKASLTPGDVHNVIRNLMSVLREQLLNSRTVRLDGLGSFTILANASGRGVNKADDVSASQIGALRVQFTPTSTRSPSTRGATRALFSGVEYQRWTGTEDAETPDEPVDPGAGGTGGTGGTGCTGEDPDDPNG